MRLGTLISIMALATTAFADPRMWEPTGRMIRGEAPVAMSASATNTNGLTLVVWVDYETGAGDVWGQLLDINGNPAWELNGRRLVTTGVAERNVSVFPWQESFVLAFNRSVPFYMNATELFLLPIDQDGGPVWQQNNGTGVRVSHANSGEVELNSLKALSDGSISLAYYDWDSYHESFGYRIHRVDASGNWLWEEPITLVPYGGYQSFGAARGDNEGNIYAGVIYQFNSDSAEFRFEKYDMTGELSWRRVYPYTVGASPWISALPVADEGCYLIRNAESPAHEDFVIQRFNSNGDEVWPNPINVDDSLARHYGLYFLPNIEGGQETGAILGWTESASLPEDSGGLRLQKMNSNGEMLWGADGVRVCGVPYYISTRDVTIVSDHQGGVMLRTPRRVNDRAEIFAVRLNSDGETMWDAPCGVQIASYDADANNGVMGAGAPDYLAFSWYSLSIGNDIKTALVDKQLGILMEPHEGRTWATGIAGHADEVRAVALTDGKASAVWRDTRDGDNYYYQIVDRNGNTELEPHGRKVFAISHSLGAGHSDVNSDGIGGFFVLQEWEANSQRRIIAAHIGPDGNHIGSDSGVVIGANYSQYYPMYPRCVPDGNGGSYVLWYVEPPQANGQIRIMRIDSLLAPAWNTPQIIEAVGEPIGIRDIVETHDGGCVVLWSMSSSKLLATKINSNNTTSWVTMMRDTSGTISNAQLVENNVGTLLVSWSDNRISSNRRDAYAQLLTQSGEPQLQRNGVLIARNTENFSDQPISVFADDNFYVIITSEVGSLENDIYAYKFDTMLEPLWSDSGVGVAIGYGWISRISVALDGAGGLFFTWSPFLSDYSGAIYGKHLNSSGNPTNEFWNGNGTVICDTTGDQNSPVVVRGTASDQFYCFWSDHRTYSQVFGQFMDESFSSVKPPTAPLVTEVSLSQNYPNPFNANTEIVFSLPRAMNAKLRIYDVTGRLVRTLVDEQFASGEHRVVFDASGVASGVYFYELHAGDVKVARKMLLLK